MNSVKAWAWGLLFLSCAVVLTHQVYTFRTEWLSQLPTWLSYFALLAGAAYNHYDWLFLAVQRLRYRLANPATPWDLSVVYDVGTQSANPVEVVSSVFIKRFGAEESKVRRLSNTRVTIEADYLAYEVWLEAPTAFAAMPGTSEAMFRLHIMGRRLPLPFKQTLAVFSSRICPFLEDVERELSVPNGGAHYFITAHFEENPFYGLYVRRLGTRGLVSFNVEIKTATGHVSVTRDRIRIAGSTLRVIESMARSYLSLAELPSGG